MKIKSPWLRYVFFLDNLPNIGNPSEADVVLVQAFGRNSITDEQLQLVVEDFERKAVSAKSEIVDTIRFLELAKMDFRPGEPNYSLAAECKVVMEKYKIQIVIAQWEVAYCLWQNYGESEWYRNSKILVLWPSKDDDYFNTRMVNERSVSLMQKLGLKKPIEIAHQAMLPRAFLILKKLGIKDIVVFNPATKNFDVSSVQRWTGGRKAWISSEIPTRIHHLFWLWFGWWIKVGR